jgi:hypothetical protein
VNKIEEELFGQEVERSNKFWLNSNGRNGLIFDFIFNVGNGGKVQKNPNHFFTKSGIPWIGHPTNILVQDETNVTITCYIHPDIQYPLNVKFVRKREILNTR